MSNVKKTEYTITKVQYLTVARELYKWTLFYTRTKKRKKEDEDKNLIPFVYKETICVPLCDKANRILELCQTANEIFPTNEEEYQIRRNKLKEAYGLTINLATSISVVYELLCFKVSSFSQWTSLCNDLISLIKGVIESDKKRFKKL